MRQSSAAMALVSMSASVTPILLPDVVRIHVYEPGHKIRIRPLGSGGVHHVHGLDGKLGGGVLGEHGDDGVEHDLRLVEVRGGALDEDVGGVQRDGGVCAVDDGRQRQHRPVRVVDDGEHHGSLDDVEEVLELLIGLVVFHELGRVELAGLLQGRKLDILGGCASYVKGPCIVPRSCVPMATSVRLRQMFWCSLSWRSMKES